MQVLEGTGSRDVRCASITNFLNLFFLKHKLKPELNAPETFTEADQAAFRKVSSARSEPAHIRAGAAFVRGLILSNMAQHQTQAYRMHEKAIATARVALDSYTDAQKAERVLVQTPIIDGRLNHGYSDAGDMLQTIMRMAQECRSLEEKSKEADGMAASIAEFRQTALDRTGEAGSCSDDMLSSVANRQPGRQCDARGVTSEHITAQSKPSLRQCTVCKQTWYCNRECQRKGVCRCTA